MAWETINYACGHTKQIQMYGPTKNREKKKAWLEGQDCPECNVKSAQKNGNAIKMKYSEFKVLERVGFSSVYGSYNKDDKTVLVYTNGLKAKTVGGILNMLYALELRRHAKAQKNKSIKSDLEKAAAILEKKFGIEIKGMPFYHPFCK